MRVDVTSSQSTVTVYRDLTDPKYYKKESQFLHHVKKELQAMGYDCIKKLAYKDGNLVDDNMYYIRDRKARWYIYDAHYAVRILSEDFDKHGEIKLNIGERLKK